ncbi:MAG: YggS family pyridoxal phosphate-dependent enzyme [Clostridia bacterium]|nr:YggS family pyridoxal phosphate-dependent enzyme [Clostridia bacterium]
MLADRVEQIRETLKKESAPYGRPPRLIAVTKTVPVDQILPLQALGVTDIAENRVQALREKLPALEGKFSIHLIGRLQTNKVKYIMKDVSLIHSVDREELAAEIDRQAERAGRVMPVLLQVNVAGEAQKGGVSPEGLDGLFSFCEGLGHLSVRGLMTMLPLGAKESESLRWFSDVRELLARLQDRAKQPELLTELSMGMSQDYALAARAGATMVRVGRALFDETMPIGH